MSKISSTDQFIEQDLPHTLRWALRGLSLRNVTVFLGSFIIHAHIAFAEWESSLLPKDFSHEPSLVKATARAANEGKAVIVYYTRTRCPPCDVLQARLRREAVGELFRGRYIFTAVWGSSMGSAEREHYRTTYGVQGAPTWLFFTAAGGYICTARGGFDSDEGGAKLLSAVQARMASASVASNTPQYCIPPT